MLNELPLQRQKKNLNENDTYVHGITVKQSD